MTTINPLPCWGVYRVLASGKHEYVSRTATTNEKLAMEIASDLSIGQVTRPDGRTLQIPAHPHIHKLIPNEVAAGNKPEDNTPAHLPWNDAQSAAASHMGVHDRTPDCTVSCIHPAPKGWAEIEADDTPNPFAPKHSGE